MSLRSSFPSAREPDSHYFFTISRGGKARRFAIRPAALFSLALGAPILGTLYLGATAFLFFRDDMVAALMQRQARQQYAYEDRLAAMRAQIDRVTSRQLLNQDSFDGKVQSLIARQAQLETRTALIATLSAKIGPSEDVTGSIAAPPAGRKGAQALPPRAEPMRFAPDAAPAKPEPDGFELRMQNGAPQAEIEGDETSGKIAAVGVALDRIEGRQLRLMAGLAAPAQRKVQHLRAIIAETGLSPERIETSSKSAVGGPFIPVNLAQADAPFAQKLRDAQEALSALDRLRRALPHIPVRKPLSGPLDVTSTFGYRTDPFFGRQALHSGMDLRAPTGTPIHATAAGRVVTAGVSGGYGNMVEIDHGHGVSTRYGHMSSIAVHEGDAVQPGSIIGAVGSTGRSTGPHLHYEVRIDAEATDPARFLRAARLVAQGE
ncbi:MAG: peptidoglycan DD-metalloendopeptidase family protein [Hyphomicrobiales bacterium]|nr:peptidoglycan DD-metalloendopeptidase family protein [Hyphomicrobiales bacterium]